ncbi:MAG: GC-type dockerin domain-anchored protein [Planctomycetota bacterium]
MPVVAVPVASAQVIPVRSSLETSSRVGLSVVDLVDENEGFADQIASTDNLGPLDSPVAISSTDGLFTANSTANATLFDPASGAFSATQTYDGDQFGDEPTAQSFTHTLQSRLEYDFSIPAEGSVRFQGGLSNSGPSPIGFFIRISVFRESTPGSGFTGPFYDQTFTDPTSPGATPIDVTIPLDAASGNYRFQVGLNHSGSSILDTDEETGSATLSWTIDAPSVCLADTNGDAMLTPADFNAWVLAFNNQAPACDQNNDGLCSPADFNAWVVNFNAGC